MELSDAIEAFGALAQATRLQALRLLLAREPVGAAAGDVARGLDVPLNTMSVHLAVLVRAGLALSERHGRSIVYRANVPRLRDLVGFIAKDCCGGRPDLCGPVFADFVSRSCDSESSCA